MSGENRNEAANAEQEEEELEKAVDKGEIAQKTIFYFFQCVGLLTVRPNQVSKEISHYTQPFWASVFSFKPLAVFRSVCPFPNMHYVSKSLVGSLNTCFQVGTMRLN